MGTVVRAATAPEDGHWGLQSPSHSCPFLSPSLQASHGSTPRLRRAEQGIGMEGSRMGHSRGPGPERRCPKSGLKEPGCSRRHSGAGGGAPCSEPAWGSSFALDSQGRSWDPQARPALTGRTEALRAWSSGAAAPEPCVQAVLLGGFFSLVSSSCWGLAPLSGPAPGPGALPRSTVLGEAVRKPGPCHPATPHPCHPATAHATLPPPTLLLTAPPPPWGLLEQSGVRVTGQTHLAAAVPASPARRWRLTT